MAELKIGPPPLPNRKKFPFVGTVRLHGLTIDIENLKGSVREGPGWKQKMGLHYGEIRDSKGTDGDKVDVYVGPNPDSKRIFIVHQNHPGNHPKAGQYDEDKVMLGFDAPEAAKEAYLSQYSRKDFFRSITEMEMPKFKKAIFGDAKGEKVASPSKGTSGISLGDKLREFSKRRKKDKPPSDFLRSKMKVGHSIEEAYRAGVKLALGEALTPVSSLAVADPGKFNSKPSNMKAPSVSKGAPAASSEGTTSGTLEN